MDKLIKTKPACAGWVTKASKKYEVLPFNIVAVTQAEYESALQNFSTRLEAWDKQQAAVEAETDTGGLDALIEMDAEFRDRAITVKDALITAWTNKHPSLQEESVSTA